jgi:RimJ/RimL family protein N-acetyltransferase
VKINIRKFKESDAQEFQEAILESVEHLSTWLPWCTPDYSIENATDWVTSAVDTWEAGTDYRCVIEDAQTLKVLGCAGINQVVLQHKVGNLGYWVRKSALNQEVCTQAARQVAAFAFDTLGFNRIEIHVLTDNKASNAVASKLGGEYEGVFRNKLLFNGKSLPAKCYSIVPSDYEKLQLYQQG